MTAFQAPRPAALVLLMACAPGLACSALLDFDALGKGTGGTGGAAGTSTAGAAGTGTAGAAGTSTAGAAGSMTGGSGGAAGSMTSGSGGAAGSGGSGGSMTTGSGGSGGTGGMPCVNGPCAVWSTGCHSVYVTPDEQDVYVTVETANNGHDAGFYHLDLKPGANPFETLLTAAGGPPALGIEGDGTTVAFATSGATGAAWKVPIAGGPPVRVAADMMYDYKSPVDVALGGTPASPIYYFIGTGIVASADKTGALLKSWTPNMPDPRAVAVDVTADIPYATAFGGLCTKACVLKLKTGSAVQKMIENFDDVGGLVAKTMTIYGPGKQSYALYVSVKGPKAVWDDGSASLPLPHADIDPGDMGTFGPGQIALDPEITEGGAPDPYYVYWTKTGSVQAPGGAVYRKSLSNPFDKAMKQVKPVETFAPDQKNPNGVAVAGKSVYWCADDGLFRAPR